MKTLAYQTLLYDEDCPLCQAYTGAFIKTGMLDSNGRKPFGELSENEMQFVNAKKAANEIALIDRKSKTVTYGIDSLLKVIGNSFPWVEKTGNYPPVKCLLQKLYSFVSYNRKVIIPSAKTNNQTLKCIPDFNFKYRFAYLFFAILITALVLFEFSKIIAVLPKGNLGREILLTSGQLFFQAVFLKQYSRKTIVNYAGNVMTVSLAGSLLLLPVIILNQLIVLPQMAIIIWFGTVVAIMFAEHFKRVKLLKLPFRLSFTWILYRIIALLLILNL